MKTFPQLLRRQSADMGLSGPPAEAPSFEFFDEQYEVLDAGAFWDETAEVLAPPASVHR